MSDPPRTDDTPFNARIIRALSGAAVLSFVVGILLAILGGHVDEVASHRADTFSRSAVGHRALVETLRRLDVPLLVSRFNTAKKAGPSTTLVLLEPRDIDKAAEIYAESKATHVVVVLPKWQTKPDPKKPAHVSEVYVGTHADGLLSKINLAATTQVVPTPELAAEDGFPVPTAPAAHMQVVDGLSALVTANGHGLVATASADDRSVWVVADPDLFNNAGFGLGDNAALVLEVLRRATAGGRTLVIDETANGHVKPPRVFAALFDFPLVLVVLHSALLLGALLWAAMRRFGAPEPAPPAYGRGREALMESTASLMRYGGHSAHALRSYWRGALRQMRDATGAPRAGHDALLFWLDRVGANRGADLTAAELDEAVSSAASSGRDEAMVRAARQIHAYRERMLGVSE